MDGYAVRATIQVDFSDALQGDFWVKHQEDDDVPTGGYVFENCPFQPPPNDTSCEVDSFGRAITLGGVIDLFSQLTDEHVHYNDNPGTLNSEQTSFTARFDYSMVNDIEFTSISNYMTFDNFYVEDGDALALPILTFAGRCLLPGYGE